MIVRQRPNALKLIFTLHGSIIPKIVPQILLITLLSTLISSVQHARPDAFTSYGTAPFTLLGIALSLFLGFRNNASYQRWWEARQLWGQLVVDTRSLARQVISVMDETIASSPNRQRRIIELSIAFTHALRHRLRDSAPWEEVERFVPKEYHSGLHQASNVPEYLLRLLGKELGQSRREGLISEQMLQNMDERLTSMTLVLSACERIQYTPLPFAYTLLVHRTTYLYCFMLPFGLASSLGWATPLISAVIAYTFFGLDALSEELEDPFGVAPNHLPLTTISRTIEINLLEALGETELPPPIVPDGNCLQ